MNTETFNWNNIINKLNIFPGDKVLVSSNTLDIILKLKKINQNFQPNDLIDSLINKIGKEGTLLFPAFNWDFCNGKPFDYHKTKSNSGHLGDVARKRKDFFRSKNPIYSFAVSGKDAEKICNLNHQSCFGKDSPFAYLINNDGKNLYIGLEKIDDAFTFDHVAEEESLVEYRFFKEFSGTIIDKLGKKKNESYKMYVRDLKSNLRTAIDEKIVEELTKIQGYEKKSLLSINFIIIDIKKAYNIMVEDLKSERKIVYRKRINNI